MGGGPGPAAGRGKNRSGGHAAGDGAGVHPAGPSPAAGGERGSPRLLFGLSPGNWSFSARAPQGARSSPVVAVVAGGLETELKNPLELQFPSALQVSVTPPKAPGGGLWRVEVWDQDAVRATFQMVARSVADGGGVCRIDGLLPGSYWVQVRDDQEKRISRIGWRSAARGPPSRCGLRTRAWWGG